MDTKTMNRRNFVAVLLASASAFGADLPPAESLLDRFVEVTGGAKAYNARKTEIAHGTVEMTAMGIKGTLTRYAAEPDHYLVTMEIPGIGKVLSGVKDGVAWEMSDLMGTRTKTGFERGEALREARFNANAVWRELYAKVETVGEESVNGEDCYKVVMTPGEGAPETLYLSKKTGLGVKMTVTASTQMGEIPAEMLFSDYKNFGGILTPARIVNRTAGQEIVITLQSVEANAEIPANQFDLPAEVAAQAGK
jgi:hypothetical protein